MRNYLCTIKRVARAETDQPELLEAMRQRYLGREFKVDRRTGVMTGALRNSYITRPEVIDFGSADNGYKAVTTLRLEQGAGSGTNVHVLVVSEYVRSPSKPFVFLDNDEIYFGTCLHQ